MISFVIVIFLLILAYLILFIQGRVGIIILRISSGTKKRRPENISHLQLPPPAELQTRIDILSKLGFSRLGETRIEIPSVKSSNSWVFVSSDKTIQTDLGETVPDMVIFNTTYNDKAVVETGFPFGENIETPYFRSHTIISSIENAYLHQVQQVEGFIKKHGIPRRIETMNDYLYWDVIYRERYSGLKMRRNTLLGILNILSFGYGIVSLIIATVLILSHRDNSATTYDYLLFLLIAIAPASLISLSTSFIVLFSIRQETKPAEQGVSQKPDHHERD
jgi:hypothetical protein